jgi:hypothetical protein
LEKAYAGDSATDDDLPEGHPDRKKKTPEELKDAESNPDNKAGSGVSEGEKGFYKEDGGKRPLRQKVISGLSPKRVAAGGVAGIITIGVFGILSVSSGPLQFIHIAQLLQRFHFASLEDNGNSRLLKLYKYAQNAREGNVANARLGFVEKRIAVNLDSKFAEIGITKKTTGIGGRYAGVDVDALKLSEHDGFEGLQRLGPEESQAWLQEKFGGTVRINYEANGITPSGTFTIEPDSGILGYSKLSNRALNKNLLAAIDIDGVPGAIDARIMGKRDAVTWHPIKKLDSKVVGAFDERFTAWLKQIKDRITGGEKDIGTSSHGTRNRDGTTTPNPEGEAASGELREITDDSKRLLEENAGKEAGGVSEGFIKQFTESTTGKAALGATAVIGLTCAVKALGENIDSLRHDMVVLPLVRTGVQAMSLGNQVMNGKDVNAEQLGFFAKELNDPKSGSWASARSIQAELGEEPTGKDIPKSASIRDLNNNSFFSGVLGDILGSAPVGVVCDVADSIFGQVANIAIGVVTAPFATGIGFAIAQTDAAKEAISGLVQWLAGSPIPTMVFGAVYGNYINYGARLASNDSQLALGGVPLTATQSAALKADRLAWQKQQFSQKSFAERTFDPYSPDSLVGKAIDSQTGNVTANVGSMFSSLINPAKAFASFGSIFSRQSRVAAASNYDYGFDEVGFSLNDLENPAFENPYDNATKAIATLAGGNGKTYISRAQKCFGVTLTNNGDVKSDLKAKVDPLKTRGDDAYPTGECTDPDPDWTSIRFYILDTKTAEAADCYGSGDTQSCNDVGFGATQDTSTSAAINSNVYFLGDSLTVGMRDGGSLQTAAQGQGWNPTIMAECGRHLVSDGTNCSGQPIFGGIHQVDQAADQTAIKNAGVVVVGLGTNDPGMASYESDVRDLVSKIKTLNPSTKIYWINLISTDEKNAAYQAMDAQLTAAAGAAGFTVIDWASQAPKVGAYEPGQYHPSNYQAMTDFVMSQLGHAP